MRRALLPLLILSLAACHGFGKKHPLPPPVRPSLVPPPAELVPADAAGRQALWAQVFGGGKMPENGPAVLAGLFARDFLELAPGAEPAAQVEAVLSPGPARIGLLVLEEEPAGGARAWDFTLEAQTQAGLPWRIVASGRGIGARKLLRLDKPERFAALRLRFVSGEPPVLSRFSAHAVPARAAVQPDALDFLDATTVRLACDQTGVRVRYTLDGSAPKPDSPVYDPAKPLELTQTTQVRAAAEDDGVMSPLEASAKVVAWDRARLRPATVFALAPERGLMYACYEGVKTLDAVRQAEPVFTGACDGLVSHVRQAGSAQVCEGFLRVEADGLYAFAADGRARVWLDGEQAVESDGAEARRTIALSAGWHAVRVAWLGDKAPDVRCFGPGFPEDGKIAADRWGR